MATSPLNQARDVGDFLYATPDAAKYLRNSLGALSLIGDGQSSVEQILDGAASKLMDEYVPNYGPRAAAAGAYSALGAGLPGSFASAVGGGMTGRLNADISRMTLPIQMEGDAAGALLQREQAEQAHLQNQINRLNYGYLVDPMLPGADDTGGDAGATAGGGGGSENLTGEGDLPLTPQSQLQLTALKAQLRRALKFAQTSPQARADAYKIYDDMASVVREDPLAKNEVQKRQKQAESQIAVQQHGETNEQDFSKGVKESIVKMTQDALTQAQEEFKALAANPDFTRIIPNAQNPEAVDAWIRNRARATLAQKYAELQQQLKNLGKDPARYLGEATTEPTDGATAAVPGQEEVPIPRQGATVQPTVPAQTAPAGEPADPNAFVPTGLRPNEALDISKEQEIAGNSVNQLAQGINDLEKGLKLNEHSLEGPLSGMEEWYRAGKLAIRNLGRSDKQEDVVLNNTAELSAILSSGVLQNLNALIKGNPTEGERAYVEKLGATINKSKGQRRVLIQRAIALLRPRVAFENMRAEALAKGQIITSNDYEKWLKWAYGETLGEQIRLGKIYDDEQK